MVRWMCDVKVKDKELRERERLGTGDYKLGTTAKQVVTVHVLQKEDTDIR